MLVILTNRLVNRGSWSFVNENAQNYFKTEQNTKEHVHLHDFVVFYDNCIYMYMYIYSAGNNPSKEQEKVHVHTLS